MAQYDHQEQSERIRDRLDTLDEIIEAREEAAAEHAFITLAQMEGYEIADLCANVPSLESRLERLLERVAMLGMPANGDYYMHDVTRAARDLHAELLSVVTDRAVSNAS